MIFLLFILYVLKTQNWPQKVIQWIKYLYENSSFRIRFDYLISSGQISCKRGVSQGDLLAMEIFCISYDPFLRFLEEQLNKNRINLILEQRVFGYVDDTLFAAVTKNCMDIYKDSIWYANQIIGIEINQVLGFNNDQTIKILGIPLYRDGVYSRKLINFLDDRINTVLNKLMIIKSACLHTKAQILNSFIFGIILYYGQFCDLNVRFRNSLKNKLMKIFWNSTPLMSHERMARSREVGGVGLFSIDRLYHSFTLKKILDIKQKRMKILKKSSFRKKLNFDLHMKNICNLKNPGPTYMYVHYYILFKKYGKVWEDIDPDSNIITIYKFLEARENELEENDLYNYFCASKHYIDIAYRIKNNACFNQINLEYRNISNFTICCWCEQEEDTIAHYFLECKFFDKLFDFYIQLISQFNFYIEKSDFLNFELTDSNEIKERNAIKLVWIKNFAI